MAIRKLVLGLIAGMAVLGVGAEASASESLLRSCVTPLNNGELGAYRFPAPIAGVYSAPASANAGEDTCRSYTWVFSENRSFYFSIMPQWGGSVASYCNHSNIEYALYSWSSGSWRYVGGGLEWGAPTDDGRCSYSVSNLPDISYGRNITKASVLPLGTSFMVAVKSSSHNHSGHDCGGAVSCYWPTNLIYVRSN